MLCFIRISSWSYHASGQLCLLDQRRSLFLALQKWEESIGQSKIAKIIGGELCLHNIHIDGFGLGEVK